MMNLVHNMWRDNKGEDVAEYALMLAVILVLVIATMKAIGANANAIFTKTANAIQ